MNRANLDHSRDRSIVARPQDGSWFEVVPGESTTFLVHSDLVGGRFTLMEQVVAPMSGPPLHSHAGQEEVFEVLEGTITFVCGEERCEAGAGTVVTVPAGMAHAWANLSGEAARMRTLFIPGGNEALFTGVAGLAPQQLAEFAAAFGTTVVGPPLT